MVLWYCQWKQMLCFYISVMFKQLGVPPTQNLFVNSPSRGPLDKNVSLWAWSEQTTSALSICHCQIYPRSLCSTQSTIPTNVHKQCSFNSCHMDTQQSVSSFMYGYTTVSLEIKFTFSTVLLTFLLTSSENIFLRLSMSLITFLFLFYLPFPLLPVLTSTFWCKEADPNFTLFGLLYRLIAELY